MKTEPPCVCSLYNFHYDQFHTCQSYGTIVLRQASVSLHLLVNEHVKVFAKGTKSRREREKERVKSRIDGKQRERENCGHGNMKVLFMMLILYAVSIPNE